MRARISIRSTTYVACLLGFLFFFVLMLGITLQYIPYNTDVAFLRIKQDYIGIFYYRLSFFVHVYSAMFALLAGFTQFSGALRRRYPQLHRRAGYLYVLVTLLLAAPSGFIIGLYANGGLVSRISFCVLAVLWWVFTLLALMRARQGLIAAHRQWMLRSFALALSAITLRAWKWLIIFVFHPHPMDAYRVVAILGWTLNLLLAELYIYKYIRS